MAKTEWPTLDEVRKVRLAECATRGHDFDVLRQVGYDGPVGVLCSNCGKVWDVPRVEGKRPTG